MRYLEDGFYVALSLKMTNAEFEGQTKTKLGNDIAKDAVMDVLKRGFEQIFKNRKLSKIIDLIIDRANKTKTAEIAARQARANSRKAKNINKLALPGKLSDCSTHSGQSELFLVEGKVIAV
jgi:DNA gyrase subunit B